MKRFTLLFITGLSLAGTTWAQQATPASQPTPSPGATPAETAPNMITSDEARELHEARSAAIRVHPELIADMQKLMDRRRDLEARINAAMIKADPGVAPIIAKIEAKYHRQSSGAPDGPSPSTPPPSGK